MGHEYVCTQAQTHTELIYWLWTSNQGHDFHPKYRLAHFSITILNYFPQYSKKDKHLIQVSGNHLFLNLISKNAPNNLFLHLVYAFTHVLIHKYFFVFMYTYSCQNEVLSIHTLTN